MGGFSRAASTTKGVKMAKADLLEKALSLGLEVSDKNTVAELETAIAERETVLAKEAESAKPTAKAGKRSAKGIEQAEEKIEKIESQKHRDETESERAKIAARVVKPARPKSERKGKNYRESYKLIDQAKSYSVEEAVELVKKTSKVKFDASVELHVNLGVDPRQADQNIRGNLVLPGGTGKQVRVAVFDDAKVASADLVGIDNISKALEKGEIKFDVLIATPANMAKLGKFARLLGPRGLMPNPKSGTVTTDVDKAVKEAKAGKVDYRVDSTGIVHVAVGKVSFDSKKLTENVEALLNNIRSQKPASIKGNFVKAIHMSSSMGPSINLQVQA